jgi:hypothetical protein
VSRSESQNRGPDPTSELLNDFAEQLSRSAPEIARIDYALIGSEDLAGRLEATRLLEALQSGDWKSAAGHNAIAGTNDLLLGIWLRVETLDRGVVDYWVAMKSPFELMDSPSILDYGTMRVPPSDVQLVPLPPARSSTTRDRRTREA